MLVVICFLSATLLYQQGRTTSSIASESALFTSEKLLEQLIERGSVVVNTLVENLANEVYEYNIDEISRLLKAVLI